ncbi:hypothetical protein LZ30DRAFT_740326 [Colletotrichum cereale]|nr:hypothetical protein LZ30DRAFT_740326 [Colletotrichum cereale]
MSFNTPKPTFNYNRQVVLGSRIRPVRVRDAVYSRLIEMADDDEDDEDCDFARWLLLQVREIFRDEIDALTAAGPESTDGRGYLAGWKDALATACGLSSLCLNGPLEDEDLSPPESPAESSHSREGEEQSCGGGFAPGWDRRWERPDWLNENRPHCFVQNITFSASRAIQQEDSSSQASEASGSLVNTPSNVSISDSVLQALFPVSSSAQSSFSSSSSAGSSSSKPAPSTTDPGQQPKNGHDRNLNKSDIIRGLDTTALLTHFERQSRLSERRIVAELGRMSILRQAIFQDRFFGRVPSFAGTPPGDSQVPGGDDVGCDEHDAAEVADGINDPFLGEAQQVRAVRQVKTLFRQWRKAAAESRVEEDVGSDEGARVTGREEDSDDGLSDDSASSSHEPEPWLKDNGGDAPPPSPGSESVYSDDTAWPSAASEPGDDTSALMAPRAHHYRHPMTDGLNSPDTDDSDHGSTRLDESGPSSA